MNTNKIAFLLALMLCVYSGIAEGMTIFVKTLNGRKISIEVESNDTIKTVKQKIEEKDLGAIDKLILIFAGQQLNFRRLQYSERINNSSYFA